MRELEGALKRVLAYCALHTASELSLELAKEALQDLLAVPEPPGLVENIQKTVADYFKIKVSDMHSKKRSRNVARPRQVAMALAKELTQMSLPEIGEAFGGRDHTTVLHACRTIAEPAQAATPALNRDYVVLRAGPEGMSRESCAGTLGQLWITAVSRPRPKSIHNASTAAPQLSRCLQTGCNALIAASDLRAYPAITAALLVITSY